MELMNYSEIQKKYGLSYHAVYVRFKRMNIKPVTKEKTEENGKVFRRSLFNAEEVRMCFNRERKTRQIMLYKLSVFDFELEHFIVKACCLNQKEANKLLKERRAAGDVARVTPHVKRG